jgi:hypothetical protein
MALAAARVGKRGRREMHIGWVLREAWTRIECAWGRWVDITWPVTTAVLVTISISERSY